MKDLQKIIEEKARKKLTTDIIEAFKLLHSNKILCELLNISDVAISMKT